MPGMPSMKTLKERFEGIVGGNPGAIRCLLQIVKEQMAHIVGEDRSMLADCAYQGEARTCANIAIGGFDSSESESLESTPGALVEVLERSRPGDTPPAAFSGRDFPRVSLT